MANRPSTWDAVQWGILNSFSYGGASAAGMPAPTPGPEDVQASQKPSGPRQFWAKRDPKTGEIYYIDESGRRLSPDEVKRQVRDLGGENVRIWREGPGSPPSPPEQLPEAPPAQPAPVAPDQPPQDPVEEAIRAADMVLTAAYGSADDAIAKLTEEGLRRLRAINEWAMAGVGEKIVAAKLYGEESQATLEQAMKAAGTPVDVEGATAPIRLEQTAAQEMLAAKQAALQKAGGTVEQSFAARTGQIRAALPAALAQARVIANEIIRKTGGGGGAAGGVLDPELEALVRENKRLEEEMKNRMYKRNQEMMADIDTLKGTTGTDRFNKAGEIAAKYDPVEYAQLLLMLGEPLDIVVDWLQKHKGMDKKSAEAAASQAQSRLAK